MDSDSNVFGPCKDCASWKTHPKSPKLGFGLCESSVEIPDFDD